jgi:hypothetical protein
MGYGTKQNFLKGRSPNDNTRKNTILGHEENANQATLRFYLTHVRIAIIKNTTTNNKCWQGCGGKGPSHRTDKAREGNQKLECV